jgi:DNA polymerase/3'-5' exonuclease PolX
MSAESRSRLVEVLRRTLAVVEYYDSMEEQTPALRAALKNRLLETVAEIDAIIAAGNTEHNPDEAA